MRSGLLQQILCRDREEHRDALFMMLYVTYLIPWYTHTKTRTHTLVL